MESQAFKTSSLLQNCGRLSPHISDLLSCATVEEEQRWLGSRGRTTYCYYLTTLHAERKATGAGMQLSW